MHTSPIKDIQKLKKKTHEKESPALTNLYSVLVPVLFHDLDQIYDLHTCSSVS